MGRKAASVSTNPYVDVWYYIVAIIGSSLQVLIFDIFDTTDAIFQLAIVICKNQVACV